MGAPFNHNVAAGMPQGKSRFELLSSRVIALRLVPNLILPNAGLHRLGVAPKINR